MKIKNKNMSIIFDFLFIVSIFILLSETIIKPVSGLSHFSSQHDLIRFIWLSSPLLSLYAVLRLLFFSAIFSEFIIIATILLLDHINTEKITLTGEPLSFNDLVSVENLSVASKYLTLEGVLFFLLFAFIGILCFIIGRKFVTKLINYFLLIVIFSVTTPFAFSQYVYSFFDNTSEVTQKYNVLMTEYNTAYIQWDWNSNALSNGLPLHLIQTSARKFIPSFSESERQVYSGMKHDKIGMSRRPKTVIYILCESCWYDKNNFKNEFQPLLDIGYKPFRAISPVYGGGTANAEFEMLTGLPSNSDVLSGIIYQEYSDFIKNNADTLPGRLHSQGYRSIAAHNFIRGFWRRDIVYRKFGFDKYIALPDMGELPPEYAEKRESWQWQPDDLLLYRSVLNEIKNNKDKDYFIHLVTMSTHGPNEFMNDFGEHSYLLKVRESISRLVDFTEEIYSLDPNAMILVYGDHKPAMNRYFYEKNVFPNDFFVKKGLKDSDFLFDSSITPEDIGDVPVFIKGGDEESIDKIITDADGKPFFCISAIVDRQILHSGLPAFNYNNKHGCLNVQPYEYQQLIKTTPPWIYSISLFK